MLVLDGVGVREGVRVLLCDVVGVSDQEAVLLGVCEADKRVGVTECVSVTLWDGVGVADAEQSRSYVPSLRLRRVLCSHRKRLSRIWYPSMSLTVHPLRSTKNDIPPEANPAISNSPNISITAAHTAPTLHAVLKALGGRCCCCCCCWRARGCGCAFAFWILLLLLARLGDPMVLLGGSRFIDTIYYSRFKSSWVGWLVGQFFTNLNLINKPFFRPLHRTLTKRCCIRV